MTRSPELMELILCLPRPTLHVIPGLTGNLFRRCPIRSGMTRHMVGQKFLDIKWKLVHEKDGFYGYTHRNDVSVHENAGFYGQEPK